jgi:predicted alpha/beta hydrolase
VSDPSADSNGSGAAIDDRHPLNVLIGGWRGFIESVAPPVLFVGTYIATSRNLTIALVVVLGCAVVLAALRLRRHERPIRVVSVLLGVSIAALFAARTGQAADYFWGAVLANAASALAFAISILVRWPLLGVVVGPVLGTGMRWRKDPDLLRAYSRASWLWVLLNVVRAVLQVPLILGGQLVALAGIRGLFYLLVIAVVFGSWAIIKRTLPADHPGIRHPRVPGDVSQTSGPDSLSS